MTDINTQKEDTKMTTNKKNKLTLAEAMTIINNASTENKIEVTYEDRLSYIIKIDDTNYIIYVPAPVDDGMLDHYINIRKMIKLNKLQLNTADTYNFTFVSKSSYILWQASRDRSWKEPYYSDTEVYNFNINIDILYDMLDNPNNIELDDKKLRNMLTKARFTGSLYELFDCGYGCTINTNNIIWYIPDDIDFDSDRLKRIMDDAMDWTYEGIFDRLGRNHYDGGVMDKIDLNIHVVSNKKIFDTDFLIGIMTYYVRMAYVHVV